jgi:hypothetical protein
MVHGIVVVGIFGTWSVVVVRVGVGVRRRRESLGGSVEGAHARRRQMRQRAFARRVVVEVRVLRRRGLRAFPGGLERRRSIAATFGCPPLRRRRRARLFRAGVAARALPPGGRDGRRCGAGLLRPASCRDSLLVSGSLLAPATATARRRSDGSDASASATKATFVRSASVSERRK